MNPDLMTVEQIARDLATEPHPDAPNVVRLGKAHLSPIEKFWVVCNPTVNSILEDILYEATPLTIANYAIGAGAERWERERPAFYHYKADALKDALARLKKVGK